MTDTSPREESLRYGSSMYGAYGSYDAPDWELEGDRYYGGQRQAPPQLAPPRARRDVPQRERGRGQERERERADAAQQQAPQRRRAGSGGGAPAQGIPLVRRTEAYERRDADGGFGERRARRDAAQQQQQQQAQEEGQARPFDAWVERAPARERDAVPLEQARVRTRVHTRAWH